MASHSDKKDVCLADSDWCDSAFILAMEEGHSIRIDTPTRYRDTASSLVRPSDLAYDKSKKRHFVNVV